MIYRHRQASRRSVRKKTSRIESDYGKANHRRIHQESPKGAWESSKYDMSIKIN